MPTYCCNLLNNNGNGLICIIADNKVLAVNKMFRKLIHDYNYPAEFSYRFINDHTKELKDGDCVFAYESFD